MARSRLHKRYGKKPRSNPAPRHNPPLLTDLAEFVLPGFGSFAASRFVTRVASTQVEQRFPSWGKHAGALAAAGSFLAAWFLAHKWRWLEKWHTPIVVGSAIAGLQSVTQLYIPALGWIVSDATPELAAGAQTQQIAAQTQATLAQLQPTNFDPNEYTYDERYDAGRMTPVQMPPTQKHARNGAAGAQPDPVAMPTDMSPEDQAINDAIGAGGLGVFQN